MLLIESLIVLVALVALLPVSVFFVQVVMAIAPEPFRDRKPSTRPRLAVVMPAHNETRMIAATLRGIVPQLVSGDRLLVVADNCSDDTAEIAAIEGAEVVERTDATFRGKGYALDHGVRHLERDPPEVVIIIDADCQVADGAIDRLARECAVSGCPVQALYLMHAPEGSGLKLRIAEFAMLVRNRVRPLGYRRLGLPCQLNGTGMAFPWRLIKGAMLASGQIVEDLKLGIDLARSGTPALFCPEAMVASDFPITEAGITSQRTRWEHGHLAMIIDVAPQLFLEALRLFDLKLLALALDLCVPPLAMLLVLVSGIFAGGGLFFAATGRALPLCLGTISLMVLMFSILLCWLRYGQGIVSFAGLVCAPIYVVWKLPLYLKFLFNRQVEWVRSQRDGE